MRKSLVIWLCTGSLWIFSNIWGKFSFLFYQCTLYSTCRGRRSYSAKCCKTRRCLKEMSCRYIAEYFTDKTNMRVIKTIKPQLAGWRQGGKFTLKRDIPLPAFKDKKKWKCSFFISYVFISSKIWNLDDHYRRIFLRWNNPASRLPSPLGKLQHYFLKVLSGQIRSARDGEMEQFILDPIHWAKQEMCCSIGNAKYSFNVTSFFYGI
jgi:hypothetical protein